MNLDDGAYEKVYVVDINDVCTLLSAGTGTVLNGILSCGDFASKELYPNMEHRFNITASNDKGTTFHEDNVGCVHSGKTSEFK